MIFFSPGGVHPDPFGPPLSNIPGGNPAGKTEAGPTKYPDTSDLLSGYFLSVLFFVFFCGLTR